MNVKINKHTAIEWVIVTAAIAVYALFINILSWQYHLVSGGLAGYALLVSYLTPWTVGQVLLVANTFLITLTFLVSGKTVGTRALYGYSLLAMLIDIFRNLLNLTPITTLSIWWQALSVGLFGMIGGITIGVVVEYGYGVGGYTLIVPLVKRFNQDIAPARIFFYFDIILGILSWWFLGWQRTVVLMINAIVFFITMDKTLLYFKINHKHCHDLERLSL
ncbi:MAG TPA: YitT family protein [Vitreimonas sp.]|nr:YitT family protein [Vitreimonas sp.]